MADGILTPCNVACGSGIVRVNSPSGSTPQCDTWLWDDMPLNSPKRPPYWNSTSGFHFHTSPNRTTLGRKNDVMSIFKMPDLDCRQWLK